MNHLSPWLALVSSFFIAYSIIPGIIEITSKKQLCDVPNGRSSHTEVTPTLGGVGIMSGLFISLLFWGRAYIGQETSHILCGLGILFAIGLADDIEGLTSLRKLFFQVLVAIFLIASGIEIDSMYGIFGIYDLPKWANISLSILVIVLIINSYNLIDGIDGLSGSLSLLAMSLLGLWFIAVHQDFYAITAFSVAGATFAFLMYNFTPAKIFMGDSGSLVLGFFAALLLLNFLELHQTNGANDYYFENAPAVALSIVMVPVFDTLRVFFIRLCNGLSPFNSDRRHIHHLLVDSGFSHKKSTFILVVTNSLFIGIAILLQAYNTLTVIVILFSLAGILVFHLNKFKIRQQKNQWELSPSKETSNKKIYRQKSFLPRRKTENRTVAISSKAQEEEILSERS